MEDLQTAWPTVTVGGGRRCAREQHRPLAQKRMVAKIGMTLSLGALVATGLMKGRGARTLHIWSGVALIGFSFWHHSLYRPTAREDRV